MLRAIAAVTLASVFGASGLAHADVFNKTVLSGRQERMHTYMSWKLKDCVPNTGIVKVIIKPQHGKLTPSDVERLIQHSRHRSNDPCIGKPMKGFQVDYQSEPGFRGTDTFKIEVTFGRRAPEIDTYTVTVK